MIELLYIAIGGVIGSLVTHFLARRIQKKSWEKEESDQIDTMLFSLDLEVESNLGTARENQKNASQGRSTAQRRNFSMFNFTAYDKFNVSITTKLKDQIGEKAINHLINGYKQCQRFNQAFRDYKEGRRPSSRSDLQNFRKIIHEFETYQNIRKNTEG